MSQTYSLKVMIRFLFLATLSLPGAAVAATLHSFGDEHFYPVVERATGIKSKNILLTGLILTAASYDKKYELSKATEAQIKSGESLGNGALSLGVVALQLVFDNNAYNYQSHLRSLVYTAGFIYGTNALAAGKWPGANTEYQTFPSIHTAVAFSTATSLTYAYGWPAGLLAYPAAAFVGYSKLGNESYRLSDVIAGATIGAWLGRAAYYENADAAKDLRLQKNPKLTAVEVFPILAANQFGTVIYYSF